MTARKPIIHGRDHCPGGADPIPCLTDLLGGTTFSEGVLALGATRDLLAYWRLGEAASPFADSNPYLTAIPQLFFSNGVDYTTDVIGALDTSQDDGAVEFNGESVVTAGDFLKSQTGIDATRFNLANGPMSFALWVKPDVVASAESVGIGGMYPLGVFTNMGWGMHLDYPAGTLTWERRQDGGSSQQTQATITSDAWHFLVGTYNSSAGMKLYVDGALADTDPATFSSGTPNDVVWLGALVLPGPSTPACFPGVIDEVSVWGDELTPDEILELYTDSGSVSGSAPIGPAGGILDGSFPNPGLASSVAGDGLAETSDVLSVNTDGSTLEISSDALRVKDGGITEAKQTLADNTTWNVATTRHGYVPKAPNDATKFLDGTGAWSVPPGSDPATDTKVWMPLTSTVGGDDVLVFDASHQLIPTLTTL